MYAMKQLCEGDCQSLELEQTNSETVPAVLEQQF